jgi:hypothetical protein
MRTGKDGGRNDEAVDRPGTGIDSNYDFESRAGAGKNKKSVRRPGTGVDRNDNSMELNGNRNQMKG